MTAAKEAREFAEDIAERSGIVTPYRCACVVEVAWHSNPTECVTKKVCRQTPGVPAAVSAPYPPADAQTSRQPLESNGAIMSDALKLKAEIFATLHRNALMMDEASPNTVSRKDMIAMLDAAAGNLAQILAPRLTEEPCCVLCDEQHHSVDPIAAVSQNRTLVKTAA